jgi:hypothetical protein
MADPGPLPGGIITPARCDPLLGETGGATSLPAPLTLGIITSALAILAAHTADRVSARDRVRWRWGTAQHRGFRRSPAIGHARSTPA